jgi:zinc metalloprotease ZmpA
VKRRFPYARAAVAAAACFVLGAAATPASAGRFDAHPAAQRALTLLNANPAMAHKAAADTFDVRDVIADTDGTAHVRLHRTHHGLPVIGGDLVVHLDARGGLRQVSQTLKRAVDIDTTPSLSAADAEVFAQRAFGGQAAGAPRTRLVIHARNGGFSLAWDVRISGSTAQGQATMEHLIVDAHSGLVIDRWDDFVTAAAPAAAQGSGVSYFSGDVPLQTDKQGAGSFVLRDTTRGNHEVTDLKGKNGFLNPGLKGTLMTDADNAWGNGVFSKKGQSDGVDAAYGHAMTWDFYQTLGRDGIANDGRGATSRVHSSTGPFGIFYNAGWNDDCFCMTYSRLLDSNNPPLISLDVAGHEMTHGVTSNTAGLIYAGESGGLNEGASDIMGSMVERFADNPNDKPDYLIGEQMFSAASPLRSMIKPSSDGLSADCYYAAVGQLNPHYSSGVTNHFFYLLAEGSQPAGGPASPTCRASDTRVATGSAALQGIGAADATKLFYRALTVYMTSDTSFADARSATLKAAADLFGNGSTQAQRVGDAWAAVNVN